MQTDRFPQAALHAVPHHRPSQRSPNREPDSERIPVRPPLVKHSHVGGKMALPLFVHPLEIRVPQQSRTARKLRPPARKRQISTPNRKDGVHNTT